MPQQLQYSVRMTPEEVLALLRANTAEDDDILETLKVSPLRSLFPRRSLIVVRMDGHKFRLHLQGGSLGANLSSPHVEGSIEAVPGGSRLNAELKGFGWAFSGPAVLCYAIIALATVCAVMLIEVEFIFLAIMLPLAVLGVSGIVGLRLGARSIRQRFTDLLSRLFER